MPDFKFYNFGTVSSTNDKAKGLVRKGHNNFVVIASKQEKGRGRFGRKWSSAIGGLYMTILIKIDDLDSVKFLTFIASISVVKTIKNLTKLNARVKWPNDVLLDGKKVCGILTETISGKENYAMVGVGLNVNQKKFLRDIAGKATSLRIEANKNFNIKKILRKIIKEFNNMYVYYQNKNYNKIIMIWKKYSHTLGKKVKVKTLSRSYIGEAVDIDDNCNLILKLSNGKKKKIVEGDIFTV